MKLIDAIKESINEYPSLYKGDTWEQSRLKVLNQIFLVNGSGYSWTKPKDPTTGGYISESKYHKRNHTKIIDKPYGKVKYTGPDLNDQYFKDKIYYIYVPDNAKIVDVHDNMADDKWKRKINIRFSGIKEEKDPIMKEFGINGPKLMEAKCNNDFSPYPISKYAKICQLYDDDIFIQPDWLLGAIDIARECLRHFKNKNRYSKDFHYPNQNRNNSDINAFAKEMKNNGQKGVDRLRKLWAYLPGEDEKARNERSWKKYQKESIVFFDKFLKKYDPRREEKLERILNG